MIQFSPHMRILVALEPADFRKGIDGLAQLCRARLESNPFSGTIFIFRNRRATSIRIITYDGQGFWLCTKRLSAGKFKHWPAWVEGGGPSRLLEAHEVHLLLWGGDPAAGKTALPPWRPLAVAQ